MDNPFKPKEVKLFNYNKLAMENKKLDDIHKNMMNTKVVKKPDNSYSTNIIRPKSYGDACGHKNN